MKSTTSTNVAQRLNAFVSRLALAGLTLLLAGHVALAARNPNPGIDKPNSGYRGDSYGELAAQWWQTMLSIPIVNGDHPLISGGGVLNDSQTLLFLGSPPAADPNVPTMIDITIPSGTALFVPIVNAECSTAEPEPFHGENETELRACANGHIDATSSLMATLDGVPVTSLQSYRIESPLFEFTLPENNVYNLPAGTTAQAVDAGIYLLVNPLKPGTHTLRVVGTFDAPLNTTFNTIFRITVQ
jgi:hypothetical protein